MKRLVIEGELRVSNADNPNLENLLQMGITAAKQGNRQAARVMFKQVLDEDKKNDRAWVWMASVAEDPLQSQQYLETALKINPSNKAARNMLKKMSKRRNFKEQRTLALGVIFVLAILVGAALICVIALAFGGG
jgi:tetratricopeptide (TPR) repeat protein